MSECFKVFFTSPDDLQSVREAVAQELGAGDFKKTADSLEHFPVFEAARADGTLSLKRIENRGERGVYRLSFGDAEAAGAQDNTDAIIDQLYSAGFEAVMNTQQYEAQFMATTRFKA